MLSFDSDLRSCKQQAELWRINEEKERGRHIAKLKHILQEERVLPGGGRAQEVGECTGSAD